MHVRVCNLSVTNKYYILLSHNKKIYIKLFLYKYSVHSREIHIYDMYYIYVTNINLSTRNIVAWYTWITINSIL